MALLQPKLSLKVAQRQILTPGLMQMVSVLALNKLELKDLINTEIVENPVLEELEESVPLIDDVALREAERDRSVEEVAAQAERDKDPFDEIDFGSYFQDYLDPGFRTPNGFEQTDKPSFENFLSQPSTLTDHLFWQLGSLNLTKDLRAAAEYVVGNLDEDGYLLAEDEELLAGFVREYEPAPGAVPVVASELLAEAVQLVQNLDPVGIATRSLRECLLVQIEAQRRDCHIAMGRQRAAEPVNGVSEGEASHGCGPHEDRLQAFTLAARIVDQHLSLLQKRDLREMSKVLGAPPDAIQHAIDSIRSLDPRPGQRFNRSDARLIEPDVAFVKRGGEFVVVMNEEESAHPAAQSWLSQTVVAARHGAGCKGLCQGALPLGAAADAQHRAAQEHHPKDLRSHRAPPGRLSRTRRRRAQADDDQGRGGRDRRPSFDREPGGFEQICAHFAGRI